MVMVGFSFFEGILAAPGWEVWVQEGVLSLFHALCVLGLGYFGGTGC